VTVGDVKIVKLRSGSRVYLRVTRIVSLTSAEGVVIAGCCPSATLSITRGLLGWKQS
jgi:hypothetical protein